MNNQSKQPFPQYLDPNKKRHFHWAVFIIIAVGLVAAVLIAIQNFKTAEEIDSLAPISHQAK